jgi:hypothetical protein
MNHWRDPGVEGGNIKIDLQEVERGGIAWIELAQNRQVAGIVNAVMNLRVP